MTITIDDIIRLVIILGSIWGTVKVVMEIIGAITKRHDKEKKWDEYEEDFQKQREEICSKYDSKIKEIEKNISDNYTDTEAKLQEVRAELYIQSETLLAVLEGLQQLKCTGPVSEAKKKLDAHLLERAYDK